MQIKDTETSFTDILQKKDLDTDLASRIQVYHVEPKKRKVKRDSESESFFNFEKFIALLLVFKECCCFVISIYMGIGYEECACK